MATTIGETLDQLTVTGELYRKLDENTIECYACGHRCKIREGRRGICQVRFNQGGELKVPWGYVAALQCDPIEKKPFFHVNPGSNALTFGMLGCDFHCGYCFTGDTMVITSCGPITLEDAFELGELRRTNPDGDISFPLNLKAVASSGTLREVKGVFRHLYEGEMIKIKPYYLPSISCTPDHRVYVVDHPEMTPYKLQAKNLRKEQYLVVPRTLYLSNDQSIDALEYLQDHETLYNGLRKVSKNRGKTRKCHAPEDTASGLCEWGEASLTGRARSFGRVGALPQDDIKGDFMQAQTFYEPLWIVQPANQSTVLVREVGSQPAPGTKSFALEDRGTETQFIESGNFYLIPICEIGHEYFEGHVFNMEVDEEHNYLANFLLVSNCQNWLTSQAMRDPSSDESIHYIRRMTPQEMVRLAHRTQASTVVSSYNEPLITSEWAVGIFKEVRAAGLMCAYVSNGNNTPEVMEYIRPYISAYKVDLKCMQDKNYRKLGGVLQNTLDGIKRAHAMGLWVEIVTLTIPGFNDSNEELWDAARFIAGVSRDIPWHVTAFHKDYKMTDPDNTDARTLLRAAEIGKEAGLRYVYAGNLPGQVGEYEDTFCPQCSYRLIQRSGYVIHAYRITGDGTCPKCGTKIPGLWPKDPSQVLLNGFGIPLPVHYR